MIRSRSIAAGVTVLLALVLTGCHHQKARVARRTPPPPVTRDPRNTGNYPPVRPVPGLGTGQSQEPQPDYGDKVYSTEVGMSSWYGPPYHNRKAASGEIFNTHALIRSKLPALRNLASRPVSVSATPALVDIVRNGRRIPAVVTVAKSGLMFFLERETGKPIYPVAKRAASARIVLRDRAAATQEEQNEEGRGFSKRTQIGRMGGLVSRIGAELIGRRPLPD